MADVVKSFIRPAEGFRSSEAAIFYSQLEDQSRILLETVEGITPQELEWQPERGMNTIGMLLAHNAVAEVLWVQAGLLGMTDFDSKPVIGISIEEDGLPLDPEAEGPANLKGKTLAYYEDILAKARAYFRDAASRLTDADMEKEVIRKRPDGSRREANVRWVLYHMAEHYAGHRGQIQLLRHHYQAIAKTPSR
jgi:uncharacterized damage-inducible protein DinB